jgi:predicted enzyme related to lactoylglutathione lyase
LATRVVLFTPEGHEDRIGTAFNGSFYCDDVSATHRQLTARGASNSFQRRSGSRGENIAIFKDPDGNPFVLSSA